MIRDETDEDPSPKTRSDWGRPESSALGSNLSKAEFWQRIAGVSFGLWSLMIPIGVWMLGSTFDRAAAATRDAAAEFAGFSKRFDLYVLTMERRVTIIEERQSRVLKTLDDMGSRLDKDEERLGLHIQGYSSKTKP